MTLCIVNSESGKKKRHTQIQCVDKKLNFTFYPEHQKKKEKKDENKILTYFIKLCFLYPREIHYGRLSIEFSENGIHVRRTNILNRHSLYFSFYSNCI